VDRINGSELDAGARYLIAEGKELGNEGLYRNSGEVREGLVQELLTKIPRKKLYGRHLKKSTVVFHKASRMQCKPGKYYPFRNNSA
jgi:phosphosulfolactate synthase (CoM biosynthesis protein A)